MKKYSIKQRITYWFENRISDNPISLIKIMAIITIVIAAIVAFIITCVGLVDKNHYFYTFWDTLASSINAWMPYSEDADYSAAHIALTSIAAIFGLFFTSFLIGVISNSLEEKIEELKKGNSKVLEDGHIVILGFLSGEYTLIKELIKSSNGEKMCIVIAGEHDKASMELLVRENVNIPKNIRLIFRTVEFANYTSLNCCSIENCKTVIINPISDEKVIKIIYMVEHILKINNRKDVNVIATIRNKEFMLPDSFTKENNILLLVLTDFVAKIIARTCTQPGLSLAYTELFNSDGSELYSISNPEYFGKSFDDILLKTDGGVPVGIINNERTVLNPKNNYVIQKDDRVIVFADDNKSSRLVNEEFVSSNIFENIILNSQIQNVLILGYNTSFDAIVNELPKNNYKVKIAGVFGDKKELLKKDVCGLENITICDDDYSIDDVNDLEILSKDSDRIVLLNNYDKDGDSADIKVMLRLTKLREIRKKLNLKFSVSIELRRAANVTIVREDDYTDYIVRSNMFSMFLSRLVAGPEFEPLYTELLTSGDNELLLLPANCLNVNGEITIQEIRNVAYKNGYIAIGYIKSSSSDYDCFFNPPLHENVNLTSNDNIVVIGKSC